MDAFGWYTGTTQRDDTGREEGGGFTLGNMCIPGQIHVDTWQKQYKIVKIKNKIKKKNLVRGNTQDTYLTEMSLFI